MYFYSVSSYCYSTIMMFMKHEKISIPLLPKQKNWCFLGTEICWCNILYSQFRVICWFFLIIIWVSIKTKKSNCRITLSHYFFLVRSNLFLVSCSFVASVLCKFQSIFFYHSCTVAPILYNVNICVNSCSTPIVAGFIPSINIISKTPQETGSQRYCGTTYS